MTRRYLSLVVAAVTLFASSLLGQRGGELRLCLRAEPKTFNPLLVNDGPSETIRYLTAGVLIRLNRRTQELEPELAVSWQLLVKGRKISFTLREGVTFSDGTPFSAQDVAYTVRMLMDPALHSPTGDSFRSSPGSVQIDVAGSYTIALTFPAPVAGLERLFDQVGILSSRSPRKEMTVLGPFAVADHKPGSYVLLQRNPHYWKRDEQRRSLPYLDSIRLEIQANRDIEALRFERGQIDLINDLGPETFDRLTAQLPSSVRDAGPSLESEQMWFNQVPTSPIPAYKKAWFQSGHFRRAISAAINRQDICRIVYRQHARPAVGPVSPANRLWFNTSLAPQAFDPPGALRRLQQEGFSWDRGVLRDGQGHRVEFSLITNAGNVARERMGTMIQQDLSQLGIRLNLVTLDFPSLIERIAHNFDYEACLLGLVNVDLDPNSQMSVWLSSASNHQWNPNQKSPATAWEAEIDRLMLAQASATDERKRKAYFDRVQEIVREEQPFLYLVNKNSLSAVSPSLRDVTPVVSEPQNLWNAERLFFAATTARNQP